MLQALVERLQRAGVQSGSGDDVKAPPSALAHLQKLLTSLVEAEARGREGRGTNFSGVLSSEYFGKLLDMFASDSKPELCRRILSAFVSTPNGVSDAIVISTCVWTRAHL